MKNYKVTDKHELLIKKGHNLSSNAVLAAEFTITSTSFAIKSAESSSKPRLDSQIFPTTGTILLNMKDW